MVDICRRCHPQQPKLELFQPCLSPWRAMVSSKEVALAVFHCSVAKHHARFESACPRQVRNWQVSRYLPESCDETFQSEWGQKQSDSSVYKVYLQFSLFCLTFFRLFALSACTGRSLFGSSCVASAIWSSVMDHGGSMWLALQGAMIWVTFPNISSKFTAQGANIPSCHCRIASDQAMLAKSMALSWRTDLFTPSPKVFRKRGWSIDIEAKHHLSVFQIFGSNIPVVNLWLTSNIMQQTYYEKATCISLLHFISFRMISTTTHIKTCVDFTIWFHWNPRVTLFGWVLTPPWVRFCSVTLSWQGPVALHPQKSRQQSLEASNDPEAIVFSLGALPNLFGVSFDWLWFYLQSDKNVYIDMYRKHWGRNQETNYDRLSDQETTTSWARLKPVTYWLNWIFCVNI